MVDIYRQIAILLLKYMQIKRRNFMSTTIIKSTINLNKYYKEQLSLLKTLSVTFPDRGPFSVPAEASARQRSSADYVVKEASIDCLPAQTVRDAVLSDWQAVRRRQSLVSVRVPAPSESVSARHHGCE